MVYLLALWLSIPSDNLGEDLKRAFEISGEIQTQGYQCSAESDGPQALFSDAMEELRTRDFCEQNPEIRGGCE